MVIRRSAIALMTVATLLFSIGCARKDAETQQQQTEAALHRDFGRYLVEQKQMFQYREQARTEIVDALSPAHRQLLASVVGQLTVAPNPQVVAAAKQLDAALTSKEKQTILAADARFQDQWQALGALRRGGLSTHEASGVKDPGMTLLLTMTTFAMRQTSVAAHDLSQLHKGKI
jgi:hypothetical protein